MTRCPPSKSCVRQTCVTIRLVQQVSGLLDEAVRALSWQMRLISCHFDPKDADAVLFSVAHRTERPAWQFEAQKSPHAIRTSCHRVRPSRDEAERTVDVEMEFYCPCPVGGLSGLKHAELCALITRQLERLGRCA